MFVAVNEGIFPVPVDAIPIAVLELVQSNVAPEGVLVKTVAAIVPLLQTVIFAGTVTVGTGFTVTVETAVPEHPPLVPVTVYDVIVVGETIKGLAVEPVFHEYVVPPTAVNVADCPLQIVGELTVTVIVPPIVTVEMAVFEHPAVVPVTV